MSAAQTFVRTAVILMCALAPVFGQTGPVAAADALPPLLGSAHGEIPEEFRQRLARIAREVSNNNPPNYTAIIRRGLDAFDRNGAPLSNGEIRAIDPTPEDVDRSSVGQTTTTVRLALDTKDARIIGGRPIAVGALNEVVAIQGNDKICSGVAIASRRVLTAAHCVRDLRLDQPGNKIVLVTSNISNGSTIRTDVTAAQIFNGSRCKDIPLTLSCPDLALLTVAKDLPVFVKVIATSEMLTNALNRQVNTDPAFYFYGFGCLIAPPLSAQRKCSVDKIGVKSGAVSYKTYDCAAGIWSRCNAGEFALSDEEKLVDSCGGDSGGPVFVAPKTPDRFGLRLVGITSRGWLPDGQCGSGGIYTKIAGDSVAKWLTDNGANVTTH